MKRNILKKLLGSSVLTAEQQAALSPGEVLELLKEGNKDFAEDHLTVRNNSQRVRDAAIGQYPIAVVLSCLDSRVPVEDIFHRGIGDIFVARVAGNIVNEDILGSLEYACKISGAKVIVVMGHEYCGAIQSAIDNVKLGNITALLAKIRPVVEVASVGFTGEKTSANPAFVERVCRHNVAYSIEHIRQRSPILREMEKAHQILIVGGIYDMKTGLVHFSTNFIVN
ncbi:carbonic anhydrase family protein [Parabacteroides sp. Marseille-P3160]|uniref:carbonic anhydrase family protein n=1 Tax=Parabacteroides sp. Marseille-P3160 TaxID=1917887 RepID=UPI0009BB777C|nr:carbonic anhydrase family protein [Parabacteroides sp. Marseille-P3160]